MLGAWRAFEFSLNGKTVRVENPPAQMTLLDFVRARGLTGAKEGCAEGECGACAVALVEADGDDRSRRCYRVVNSCLMFLPMAAGREIYTVEALAVDGELSEAQRAMASGGGSQCGYCTPGFVVSLFAEQYRRDRTGPCDTMALAGNLCRCTGYRPIRDAALSLGPAPDDEFRQRLDRAGAPLSSAFSTRRIFEAGDARRVSVAAARRIQARSSSPARPTSASSPTCSRGDGRI